MIFIIVILFKGYVYQIDLSSRICVIARVISLSSKNKENDIQTLATEYENLERQIRSNSQQTFVWFVSNAIVSNINSINEIAFLVKSTNV